MSGWLHPPRLASKTVSFFLPPKSGLAILNRFCNLGLHGSDINSSESEIGASEEEGEVELRGKVGDKEMTLK